MKRLKSARASNVSINTNVSFLSSSSTNSKKHPAVMTLEQVEVGSTQKRSKNETIENFLQRVTHVSIVNKDIELIQNMYFCKNLSVLYLYDNNITQISGLENCLSLTRLYLQNNQIAKIEGLDHGFSKLAEINLSGNRISTITGLHALPSLQTLHIDNQKINGALDFDSETMNNLRGPLQSLSASGNGINDISLLTGFELLEFLNLSNNSLHYWEDIEGPLSSCPSIRTLSLLCNPINQSMQKLRQKTILVCPALESFNSKEISDIERNFTLRMDIAKQKQAQARREHSQLSRDPSLTSMMKGMNIQVPVAQRLPKPVPHLPPYASQYRDLMLQQMAEVPKPQLYPAFSVNVGASHYRPTRMEEAAVAAEVGLEGQLFIQKHSAQYRNIQ